MQSRCQGSRGSPEKTPLESRPAPMARPAPPFPPQCLTSHICSWKNRLSFSISSAISAPLISVRIIPWSLACSFFSFSILVLCASKEQGQVKGPRGPAVPAGQPRSHLQRRTLALLFRAGDLLTRAKPTALVTKTLQTRPSHCSLNRCCLGPCWVRSASEELEGHTPSH